MLFIPIALGLAHLYAWARPSPFFGEGPAVLLAKKAEWLRPGYFVLRAALYFVLFVGVSELLSFWSRRQDHTHALELTVAQRKIGAAALPILGFAVTFAAFDWLMSLDPGWASTIFGLYWFAGGFLGALALLIVVVSEAERVGPLRGRMRPGHYYSLGKLLFAFVCFWAYIAFCQFMLMWIANLPEEASWYVVRTRGPYRPLALSLVFGQFAVPFFVLLSKRIKLRPTQLSAVALWLLGMRYVDMYWVVMPSVFPEGNLPHWTDLTAFAGMGALALSVALFRARGQMPLPVGDPYLEDSLRYSKA